MGDKGGTKGEVKGVPSPPPGNVGMHKERESLRGGGGLREANSQTVGGSSTTGLLLEKNSKAKYHN
jgi:hypothetical protein